MGWAIAGGVLGLILMFGAYRWAMGWVTVRSGGVSIPMIGTRPRRLAGLPEEAPAGSILPPAMEILRYGDEPVVVEPVDETVSTAGEDAPAAAPELSRTGPDVRVTTVNQGSDDSGEFVEIANSGPNPVQLEGWKLTDEGGEHTYDFPTVVIAAGSSLRVHMWRGEDTETDLYVGRRSRWWNNDGGTAYLYDVAGNLVHSLAAGGGDQEAADS